MLANCVVRELPTLTFTKYLKEPAGGFPRDAARGVDKAGLESACPGTGGHQTSVGEDFILYGQEPSQLLFALELASPGLNISRLAFTPSWMREC